MANFPFQRPAKFFRRDDKWGLSTEKGLVMFLLKVFLPCKSKSFHIVFTIEICNLRKNELLSKGVESAKRIVRMKNVGRGKRG